MVKQTVEEIFELWFKFRRKKIREIEAGQPKISRLIAEALAFWAFAQERWKKDERGMPESIFSINAIEERHELLSPFLKYPNPHIRLIARIESLPNSVWGRILWRSNIDFQSHESFLRRLDKIQELIIYENYRAMWEDIKIPPIFTKWEIFRLKITWKALRSEVYRKDERNQKKGAWFKNFLGLDWGWPRYPNGKTNDSIFPTEETENGNFIVQEKYGGKFWWLLRTSKSNYVYRPDREIELKKHICLDSLYAFPIHFLFWILSPICFYYWITSSLPNDLAIKTFGQLFSWPFLSALLCGLPGFFTSGWVAAAITKFSCIKTWELIQEISPLLSDALKAGLKNISRFFKKRKKIFASIGLIASTLFAIKTVYNIVYDMQTFLAPTTGIFGGYLIASLLWVWPLFWLWRDEERSRKQKFSMLPIGLVIPTMIAFGLGIEGFGTRYAKEIIYICQVIAAEFSYAWGEIAAAVTWIFHAIPAIISFALLLLKLLALPLTIMILTIAAGFFLKRSYEKMNEKTVGKIVKITETVLIIILIAFLGYAIDKSVTLSKATGNADAASFWLFLISFVLISGCLLNLLRETKSNDPVRQKIYEDLNILSWRSSTINVVPYKKFLGNEWLENMSSEARQEFIYDFADRFLVIFFDRETRIRFISKYIKKMTPTIADHIRKNLNWRNIEPYQAKIFWLSDSQKYEILKKIFNGLSLSEAIAEIEEEKEKREKILKKIKKILAEIAWPFLIIITGPFSIMAELYAGTRGIVKNAVTHVRLLYRFISLLKKVCPTVMKKENLHL